jgi:hypothetical protein
MKPIICTRLSMRNTFENMTENRLTGILLLALVLISCFLGFSSTHASGEEELTIELALGDSEIALGEQTSLTITVSGQSGLSDPAVPDVDGLELLPRGRTQSVQIINADVRSSKIFRYAVVPKRTGEFRLGPALIKRGGRVHESEAVRLSVVGARQSGATAAKQKTVIVEASVDNDSPYLGQQITMLVRFARVGNVRIGNAGYSLPDLSEFWNEGIENRREYTQTIDDVEYLVTEIAVPLFPIKEGDITVDAITFRYDEVIASERSRFEAPFFRDPFGRSMFDDDFFKFFRSEQIVKRTVSTRPILLHVRPLPTESRPEGFKGAVGSFNATARLSEHEVKAGESVTLTVALSGQGNIRDLSDPNLTIEGVKIYSDTPSVDVKNYNDSIVGEKVYRLALVPQSAGEINIPSMSIPYFNPQTARYEFAASAPLTLRVLQSEKESLITAEPGPTDGPTGRRALAKTDILPIHERLGPIENSRLELWLRRLRPVAYPFPIVMYALCFAIVRHRERLRSDVAYRRSRFALKRAEAHLDRARKAVKRGMFAEVFTECARAVTEYLADKFNVPAGGLTPSDIESTLSASGAPEGFVRDIVRFLEECDYRRFASLRRSPEAAREHVRNAARMLERLEKEEVISR